MAKHIEWLPVYGHRSMLIGAVGFLGPDIAVLVAFHEDLDMNLDGKVSTAERIAGIFLRPTGSAITRVAANARVDMDIALRDRAIDEIFSKIVVNFGRGLIAQGIYTAYFARGVKFAGAGVAQQMTSSMVKQFVIRKGFESAVKTAFLRSVGN